MTKSEADAKAAEPSSPPVLQSLDRALVVLELLSRNPMRASQIADELDIAWATLHRTLNHLEQRGYLHKDTDSKVYSVGVKLWMLGSTYVASHTTVDLASMEIRQIGDVFPEAAMQLVEREGRQAVVISSYNAIATPITKATIGVHLPLHSSSKGHLLLAHAPEEFIEEYLAGPLEMLTSETIIDPDQLRERLALIREQGFAKTAGDVQLHTASLATPIYDRKGQVVAAICAVIPRATIDDQERVAAVVAACQRAAASVSVGLGWRLSVPQPARD